jgi:hypothetical protein
MSITKSKSCTLNSYICNKSGSSDCISFRLINLRLTVISDYFADCRIRLPYSTFSISGMSPESRRTARATIRNGKQVDVAG